MVSAAGPHKTTLFVQDAATNRKFLVDTGADVSVFPASSGTKRSQRCSSPLSAANGTSIRTWGTRRINVALASDLTIPQLFYIADVTTPILGADFFIRNNILIDMARKRLVHTQHTSSTPLRTSPLVSTLMGLSTNPANQFSTLLQSFPDILAPGSTPA